MIDAGEPKDGDFVRYVEDLVRMPQGASLPKGYGTGEVLKRARGERQSLLQTLRDVLTNQDPTRPRGDASPGAAGYPTKMGTPNAGTPHAGIPHAGIPHAGIPQTGTPHAGAPNTSAPRSLPAPSRKRTVNVPGDTAAVARLLGRLASIAIFAGVVLLAMSFAEDPPVPIDPIVGVAMLAGAAVLKRIAKGIA